ncbi:T9SS type A sorting domain-containing protein [Dyadobacter sp. 676]|uniref:T9SS type A sorting domain-containing protein n=1 Tax=Dyadobacter sp. 676 TaxID=3088362 RepID=A0AAU8FJJ9_9BACT
MLRQKTNSADETVDMTPLQPGMYILHVESARGVRALKIWRE